MKKTKLVLATLAAGLTLGLAACGSTTEEPVDFSFSAKLETGYKTMKVGDNKAIEIKEFAASDEDPENPVVHTYEYTSSNPQVATVSSDGAVTAVAPGIATISVHETVEDVTRNIRIEVYDKDPANGAVTYSSVSYEEKGNILGKLEEYAMDNNLTGISLFENGGYTMYNPRIEKGTNTYISGYGFGILGEGNITADLASETKAEWKRYYHSASSSDPKSINALNAKQSDISDLASYISSGYWGTKMNAAKNGYDWYGQLAKNDRPLAVYQGNVLTDAQSKSAKFDTWRIYVKTGSDGLKYSTLSTKTLNGKNISEVYNNKGVELEDYVYAFKVLFTQSFAQYRGSELAADKTYGIKGGLDYFNATKAATGVDEAAWASNNVGVTSGEDATGKYIDIQLVTKQTQFYAMYCLASSLYQPLCQDFIKNALGNGDEVKGIKNYGAFVQQSEGIPAGVTPVDTILSLGAYTLETWEEDKTIAFKQNTSWVEKLASNPQQTQNLNRIPGVKITVYPGATTDTTLLIKEFLKGNIDAARLPTPEYVKKYRNDTRTTSTLGDSVFKLNVNSCTREQWVEKFGVQGKVAKTAEADYWNVKPWMSNKNFLKGLNFSIDRDTFATNRGSIASNNYFSSNYMIDPENGISYNTTEAHKQAKTNYYPETNGYNLSAAKIYFRQAVAELVESGDLELGTKSKPTKISIDIWWMYQSDIKDYGNEISGYIQKAFNSSYVCDGKVKLTVNNFGVTNWIDVYYDHLMVGQYDLGFGSISGNSLDPLNFLEVLCSDNRSTMTLNWGPDTSVVDPNLIYDGKAWSFDSLYSAADSYAIVENGKEAKVIKVLSEAPVFTRNADGSLKATITTKLTNTEDITTFIEGLVLNGTTDSETYSDYFEIGGYTTTGLYGQTYGYLGYGTCEIWSDYYGAYGWDEQIASIIDSNGNTYLPLDVESQNELDAFISTMGDKLLGLYEGQTSCGENPTFNEEASYTAVLSADLTGLTAEQFAFYLQTGALAEAKTEGEKTSYSFVASDAEFSGEATYVLVDETVGGARSSTATGFVSTTATTDAETGITTIEITFSAEAAAFIEAFLEGDYYFACIDVVYSCNVASLGGLVAAGKVAASVYFEEIPAVTPAP